MSLENTQFGKVTKNKNQVLVEGLGVKFAG